MQTLFTIEVLHDYFNDKQCHDIFIEPSPACAGLLKKYGLLFHNALNRPASVLTAASEKDTAYGKPEEHTAFTFLVFLRDASFLQYTQLPAKGKDEVYAFTNVPPGNEPPGSFSTSVIKNPYPAQGKKHLLGILNITFYSDQFVKGNNPVQVDFVIQFKASGVQWKYYLLVNGSRKNVKIDGTQAGIEFRQAENASDNTAKAILARFPGASPLVYVSAAEIPCRETGIRNIRLINADNNMVLVSHLANPGIGAHGIKIISAKA